MLFRSTMDGYIEAGRQLKEKSNGEVYLSYIDPVSYTHLNEADMENSKNQGFTVLDAAAGTCKVRLAGNVIDYTVGTANENVPDGIQKIIKTVIDDYSYLLIG